MDKAHVCLFDIRIQSNWFQTYDIKNENEESVLNTVCVDSHIFYNILSMTQDQHSILVWYNEDDNNENIHVDLENTNSNGDFNKYFTIPLADLSLELLAIPDVEYDAEFSIHSKKMCEITSQLLIFGDIMNIHCSEEKINICSKGVSGEMMVNIPIDDLSEYSISEGETMNLSYSLNYLSKMCMTTKLSNEIGFSISAEYPMKIRYDLGDESHVMFFIAPRIED